MEAGRLTVVGVVDVGNIAPSIVPDDVERGTVNQRSKVDREDAAAAAAAAAAGRRPARRLCGRRRRRRRRRGGGSAVGGAAGEQQRVVEGRAGGHVRHVERPCEGVDGRTRRLVGEAEQGEDAVRDGRAY